MAQVLNNMAVDSLDRRRDRDDKSSTAKDTPNNNDNTTTATQSSPPPPLQQQNQPPPSSRRRDRDSRERRDDRDLERQPNRRGPDYYDRNRSPPMPRDRDSDYKRRSTLSPPPPVSYRDRMHSPPPRRSPPYKRSRRDDGGYDGKRGSPRGVFGPGDRRFGYDYAGGYEREMGGRPGYGDERPHGRHISRPFGGYSGHSDWDSGRSGYNEVPKTGSVQREGLMSYKQFIQELEDDILPAEAERRYQEYKSEYISTQKHVFFDAHRDEEWLKDKYHPTNLLSVIERRNELARKVAKDFLLDLQSGTVDLGPGVNALPSNKSGQTSDPNSDDEADTGGKRRRHGRGPGKESDVLSTAPKAHPVSSEPRRIQIDIEQAQALVQKLDLEKGIEENILCGSDNNKMSWEKSHGISTGPVIIIRGLTSVKGLEDIELLDTLISYMWRIHGVDYYGMVETSEAKGFRHLRGEGKSSDLSINGSEWEKKLDSFWQERLRSQDPLEIMTAKDKIDAAAVDALDPFVRKIRDEKYGWKYGCGAKGCTKLFHAAEFVHKHLKLKHPELVMELTVKVREELYFQNYMNDVDAPGGTPVMQQPLPKEKPLRRKLVPGNRLKDERGNRRGRDYGANGSDRYDRPDSVQSSEFPLNNDGPDGASHDESVFDAFGGGIRVGPPFSSDIAPPPVLMPVPGAGPLGPFVPAPPEVAMQMFREQGGPPPFEGGGRNGRPGPQLSGPGPILLSPEFRQDPRQLRSYQDLDAPEDEVTVIDYRSL
ncbi:serrate RNA effector molecule-like [Mangifera indica]|uniref:serrate RNA effector molecule-like n=1 Tax=Mangifera indica TaxID=29780 RepID=UPI001CFACCFA|nr:serrate RNA effector molecule-like [Mangifera indica]XP_044479722.1 serrate RNA effector molecule-like [Mangifera indica]